MMIMTSISSAASLFFAQSVGGDEEVGRESFAALFIKMFLNALVSYFFFTAVVVAMTLTTMMMSCLMMTKRMKRMRTMMFWTL